METNLSTEGKGRKIIWEIEPKKARPWAVLVREYDLGRSKLLNIKVCVPRGRGIFVVDIRVNTGVPCILKATVKRHALIIDYRRFCGKYRWSQEAQVDIILVNFGLKAQRLFNPNFAYMGRIVKRKVIFFFGICPLHTESMHAS